MKQVQYFFPLEFQFCNQRPIHFFLPSFLSTLLWFICSISVSSSCDILNTDPISLFVFFPNPKIAPFWWENPLANFYQLINNICSISDGCCWLTLCSSSRISFLGKAFINTSLFAKGKHCFFISIADGVTVNSSLYNWGKFLNSVE